MAAPLSRANRSRIMDYLKSQDISDLSSSKIAKLIEENLEIPVSQPTALKLKNEILDSIPDDESNEDVPIIEPTKSDKTRQLSIEQQNAIDYLLQGKSDRATAEAVGVSRQYLLEWRNHDPLFIAEVNRQRSEMWNETCGRMRHLAKRALDVLELQLDSDDPKASLAAAKYVLQGNHLLGDTSLSQGGPTTPEDVILIELRSEARKELAPEIKRKKQMLYLSPLGGTDNSEEEIEALAQSRLKKALAEAGLS